MGSRESGLGRFNLKLQPGDTFSLVVNGQFISKVEVRSKEQSILQLELKDQPVPVDQDALYMKSHILPHLHEQRLALEDMVAYDHNDQEIAWAPRRPDDLRRIEYKVRPLR